jgi:hypothetical protein
MVSRVGPNLLEAPPSGISSPHHVALSVSAVDGGRAHTSEIPGQDLPPSVHSE